MYNENLNNSPVDDDDDVKKELSEAGSPGAPKKAGRRKINIEFIEDKSRRHITFSKRKAGIMKKAYELSTLTGTQVLLLVASETGHVYTFATPKLQPLITKPDGKNLIQACLNAPEVVPPSPPAHHPTPAARAMQPYSEPPMLYPTGDHGYPSEHPNQSSAYDKEDKEHRMPSRNQPEPGKGLAYGAPFQTSGAPMMMGGVGAPHHAPPANGNMGGYPAIPASRYMPPSAAHAVGNAGPGSAQYNPPFSSSVAGMMAQFPSPGFGQSAPAYLWPHSSPVPNSNSSSNSHEPSSKSQSEQSHHSEDGLTLTKD